MKYTPLTAERVSAVTRSLLEMHGIRCSPNEYQVYDAEGNIFAVTENEAQADLIVRVVNAHDELVRALRLIRENVRLNDTVARKVDALLYRATGTEHPVL